MLSIAVHNIQIRASHGMYPEEAILGNDFEVDVDVCLPVTIKDDWPLIDYARISEIVHFVLLAEAVPLLEMLVRDIWLKINQEWPELSHIKITIRKLNPQMKGSNKHAQVTFES
ncbi:MAG: dihydroneopterin aldolase [Chitinophagaceae bacterium]